MILELFQSRHKAPRKKFRGKARYFRKITRSAREFSLAPGVGPYCDFWHYHADWPGWGNISWSIRFAHIKALAEVFCTIDKSRNFISKPFQCWILIVGRDAGEDATFLHTPNANGTIFPFIPEMVDWHDDRLLPVFKDLLPDYTLRIGHVRSLDEEEGMAYSSFFIYSPEVGVPLEE